MRLHDASSVLRLGPPLSQARGAVVLLHGRGGAARDIAGLAGVLMADNVAFLAPSATNGTWYPQRLFAPLEQNEPWLSSSLEVIGELIDEAVAAGIPLERIGIAGFSQGGCLSLEYAARNPQRYGFVAGLSGTLIGPLDTVRSRVDLHGTPVLVACAEGDTLIPLAHVEKSAATLAEYGARVTKQLFPGGDHRVFPAEIAWIDEQLASWR